MWQYILKRVLLMVPTLLGVALVVFLLMNVVPGDIAMLILGAGEQGGDVNMAELQKVRQKLGLDRPLYEQFFSWVWGIVRLDFGTSLWTGAPVLDKADRVLGVVQICHKGFDLASAGPDFTLDDLQKLELVAKALAHVGFLREQR